METGLIFVSVQTEVGVFVENFFNFSFSVIGTYYTTTFTGTPKTVCHLYELLSNQNVSWAQPDEDLETLRRYEFIKWIYLVPLQPALAQSNFALRQYACLYHRCLNLSIICYSLNLVPIYRRIRNYLMCPPCVKPLTHHFKRSNPNES